MSPGEDLVLPDPIAKPKFTDLRIYARYYSGPWIFRTRHRLLSSAHTHLYRRPRPSLASDARRELHVCREDSLRPADHALDPPHDRPLLRLVLGPAHPHMDVASRGVWGYRHLRAGRVRKRQDDVRSCCKSSRQKQLNAASRRAQSSGVAGHCVVNAPTLSFKVQRQDSTDYCLTIAGRPLRDHPPPKHHSTPWDVHSRIPRAWRATGSNFHAFDLSLRAAN